MIHKSVPGTFSVRCGAKDIRGKARSPWWPNVDCPACHATKPPRCQHMSSLGFRRRKAKAALDVVEAARDHVHSHALSCSGLKFGEFNPALCDCYSAKLIQAIRKFDEVKP